jgi:hypothetical protein
MLNAPTLNAFPNDMPTLTIKGVPPELHEKLKERAERHRRGRSAQRPDWKDLSGHCQRSETEGPSMIVVDDH